MTRYTLYNLPNEVRRLNLNTVDLNKVVVFPARIYNGELFRDPKYDCDIPRDTRTRYFIDDEQLSHPDHFSKFGYRKCRNGYCLGIQTQGYITSESCAYNECVNDDGTVSRVSTLNKDPKGMAPEYYYRK